jgi:hypothetical protein
MVWRNAQLHRFPTHFPSDWLLQQIRRCAASRRRMRESSTLQKETRRGRTGGPRLGLLAPSGISARLHAKPYTVMCGLRSSGTFSTRSCAMQKNPTKSSKTALHTPWNQHSECDVLFLHFSSLPTRHKLASRSPATDTSHLKLHQRTSR